MLNSKKRRRQERALTYQRPAEPASPPTDPIYYGERLAHGSGMGPTQSTKQLFIEGQQ